MEKNEFEKGKKFSYAGSIAYAEKAVVSKHVLKKETGNISLMSFDKEEGLTEHTSPYDAVVMIVDGKAEIIINGVSNILEAGEIVSSFERSIRLNLARPKVCPASVE